MSNAVLVLGQSGAGKSTSIRNLPSEQTFIINVIGKPLPFRGAKVSYTQLTPDGLTGNYYASDDHMAIMRVIKLINTKRLDIKYLVIDDFGYTLTNSFMRKASEKGYDKFVTIGKDAFDILDIVSLLRDDLFCFVMMHTEADQNGFYKPRTIGKMVDQYVCIEGKFSFVYYALFYDNKYVFLTNHDGTHLSKTPYGLHEDLYIPNDLFEISKHIEAY
jgi:hypothetical protein